MDRKGVDNSGWNIMNQDEFFDMGSINRNYMFNVATLPAPVYGEVGGAGC